MASNTRVITMDQLLYQENTSPTLILRSPEVTTEDERGLARVLIDSFKGFFRSEVRPH